MENFIFDAVYFIQFVGTSYILVYFNLLILMRIVKKPSYAMCWSKDHIFSTPIFSRIMPPDEFDCIEEFHW